MTKQKQKEKTSNTAHANTPQTVKFDSLGREFLTEDDNGAEGKYTVRNQLDITSKVTKQMPKEEK